MADVITPLAAPFTQKWGITINKTGNPSPAPTLIDAKEYQVTYGGVGFIVLHIKDVNGLASEVYIYSENITSIVIQEQWK